MVLWLVRVSHHNPFLLTWFCIERTLFCILIWEPICFWTPTITIRFLPSLLHRTMYYFPLSSDNSSLFKLFVVSRILSQLVWKAIFVWIGLRKRVLGLTTTFVIVTFSFALFWNKICPIFFWKFSLSNEEIAKFYCKRFDFKIGNMALRIKEVQALSRGFNPLSYHNRLSLVDKTPFIIFRRLSHKIIVGRKVLGFNNWLG